ncbi:MAG: hypothetical protein WC278_01955 [Bacilli bacterium]|jgi:RNA polymerase sigma factor (sigma-70 family)|nr:hypothetical protein [Bacilli bacterium]MDD2681702.1 hypothetical protein [Bacilli bacterium]MDD3121547.1 hypothetical protein [Bacilli bacterium]MDD4062818.1 hypothetical protein [Bacilli bacterium]MDD4482227.1 hypothetical protein [Bacilli bacterium]
MYNYNDNELLYLIREKHDDALDIMFLKYSPLIKTRISKFRIQKDYEDFYQEGLIALNIAISRYIDLYDKTFNKYFDLILQRKFIQILKKETNNFYNVVYFDELNFIHEEKEKYTSNKTYQIGMLSDFEKHIFKFYSEYNLKAGEIANKLNIDVRRVYNALNRIKKKIRDQQHL